MAKEFIVYSATRASFEALVASGEVDNTQIGIIAESGEFWENGNYHPLVLLTDYLKKTDAVALAKDLTGSIEATPEEFTFRTSAGTKSIRDESAVIRRIKGNTSVWSQSIPSPENWTPYWSGNLSASVNDGVYRATLLKDFTDGSGPYRIGTILTIPPQTIGHKYFIGGWLKTSLASSNNTFGLEMRGTVYNMYPAITSANTWTYVGRVFTLSDSGSNKAIYLRPSWYYVDNGLAGNWYEAKDFVLIDLTALYGAGNEPTGDSANATVQAESIKQFKKLYPESYYPYCEPEVRSMRATGIETIGANAFDKDSVVGGLINADGTVTSNDIYSVAKIEVVPNEKYTLTNVANAANTTYTYALYDSEDRVISVDGIKNSVTKPVSVSGDVTMPISARYMRVVVHNDYLDSCCVNLKHSGTLPAEEATYFKEVRMLPDIAKYFPEGMHGIGDVYDEINDENAIKRFGVVDLGTLTWSASGGTVAGTKRWENRTLAGVVKPVESSAIKANIKCDKYNDITANDTWNNIDGISVSPQGYIQVYDTSLNASSDADFVASLQGVMLVYELAEPIVTPITEPLQLDYKVADFGTEKMLSDLPSSPFRADIVYQFNAADRIRDNARNIERLEEYTKNMATMEDVINAIPTEVATATRIEAYGVQDGSQLLYPNIMYEYPLGIGQAGSFVIPNIVQLANSTYDNRWMLRLPSIALSSILSYPYTIKWKDGVEPTFSEPCTLEIYLKEINTGEIIGEWKIYR